MGKSTDPMEGGTSVRRFGLELDSGSEPVAGRFRAEEGEPTSFTGYVQLIALLERSRARSSVEEGTKG